MWMIHRYEKTRKYADYDIELWYLLRFIAKFGTVSLRSTARYGADINIRNTYTLNI